MRILVTEDQAVTALLLCRSLEKMGHEVIWARDGVEAWQMLETHDIRLVLSDWMMPRMSGVELCRKIRSRAQRPYTYVILLTCRTSQEDRLEGLRAGADDLMCKPTDRSELAIRLEIARRILGVQEDLEQKNTQLAQLATIDALTGLRNRRAFTEAFKSAVALSVRQASPLSVIMLDVDLFKTYNDAFGHPAGDDVLRAIANTVAESVRSHDMPFRYGGEELVVILPGTGVSDAAIVAERIRGAIEAHEWPHRRVTASLGVASALPGSCPLDLVEQADRALYDSKHAGRNRVTLFPVAVPLARGADFAGSGPSCRRA